MFSRQGTVGWPLLALSVVVALGISFAAYQLAGYSWGQVVDYDTPFTDIDPDTIRTTNPAPTTRTVLIIVDGLTDEASRSMPSMRRLRAVGADVMLAVPQPSLSYPTWTTILSGAPPQISGVTTNWYERRVEVETLLDVAVDQGLTTLVAGPTDLDMLYDASRADASAFTDWVTGSYMTGGIVDDALRLDGELGGADLVIVLLPDIDDAGHAYGAASVEYAETVERIDEELTRLIDGLNDGRTVFCVTPDHGHLATGGHGGWEESVIRTSAVFSGPGVIHTKTEAGLEDIAPTVAVLAGISTPAHARGAAITQVLANPDSGAVKADLRRAGAFAMAYTGIVAESMMPNEPPASGVDVHIQYATADNQRLDADRADRTALFVGAMAVLLAFGMLTGLTSWRAMVSAIIGAAVYIIVYNGLYFLVHGYTWSLSAFNDESMVQTFFNMRTVETVVAGLLGCTVAAIVYPLLRKEPRPSKGQYRAGWLALGVLTTLVIQALLIFQVAVFWREWGAAVVWRLPDLEAAFKYDLDLIQMTALGAVAVVGPAITYTIGRIHPRIRRANR